MTAYLGPVGGLVPFNCPSAVEIASHRSMSYQTTLEGRVKAQRGPKSRRQWQVGLGSVRPGEAANLQALMQSGEPPWVWVEPYAQATNLFTPEQSTLEPGAWWGPGTVASGSVMIDGVFAPRSVSHPNGGTIDFGHTVSVDRTPVIPGVPVSASAYVRGGGVLGISWRDWQDGIIYAETVPYDHSTMARISIENRTPPPGAAQARVWLSGMRQAAMPCLSWTPDAPPWSIGRGCKRAVTEGLSEVVQIAARESPSLRRSALSFTVREVG